MGALLQDMRYGIRMLFKNPGFTAIAVLTLALGIGANTAIFSVLDSVLLRKLPVVHSEQLVLLADPDSHGQSFGSESGDRSLLAYSEFEYLRDHNEVFSSVFAADSSLPEVRATLGGSPTGQASQEESLRVRLVSGDYFSTLGVTPAAGRTFTSEVDRARGGSPFAVASYSFWKRRFNLDPAVLGKSIRVNQHIVRNHRSRAAGILRRNRGRSPGRMDSDDDAGRHLSGTRSFEPISGRGKQAHMAAGDRATQTERYARASQGEHQRGLPTDD